MAEVLSRGKAGVSDLYAVDSTRALPGRAVPYRLSAGTGLGYLLGGQVNRFLATSAETGGTMAIANSVGPIGSTVPPHYHNDQHDIFYIAQGSLKVWAGGHGRVLKAGDAASIPPHTTHSFEVLSHYTEIVSPVVPTKWPRFFEIMGQAYDAGAYPAVDPSGPPTPEKIAQVQAEDIMVRQPGYEFPEVAYGTAYDTIPESREPYFLAGGEGPRHTLFGQVCFQVIPGFQTAGGSATTVTEGPEGPPVPRHVHKRSHKGIFCLAGRMRVWVGSDVHDLVSGDFVNIPANVEHTYALGAAFNRFLTMVAPAGPERLFEIAGEISKTRMFAQPSAPADGGKLAVAAGQLDIEFTG